MGFKEGQLFLDSPNGTYYLGQPIQGKLVFEQEKAQSFRGLYVKLHGFCHVQWSQTYQRHGGGSQQIDYISHEDYIESQVYMLGGGAGEYTIQPGKYEFPFRFHLPDNCPSSYEAKLGHIRYEIKAVVDRAYKFNLEKKALARVMAPMDLNLDPYCKEPIVMDMQKLYYLCCFKRGSLDVLVKLPLGGYCPGETVPIEIACTSSGTVGIKDIKFSITKKVTFIATTAKGKQMVRDTVVEARNGPVAPDTSGRWTVAMVVPPVDVYNVLSCKYIIVRFKFKVQVIPAGLHTNLSTSRRIVIGTIPLNGHQAIQQVLSVAEGSSSRMAEHGSYPDQPPPYAGHSDTPDVDAMKVQKHKKSTTALELFEDDTLPKKKE